MAYDLEVWSTPSSKQTAAINRDNLQPHGGEHTDLDEEYKAGAPYSVCRSIGAISSGKMKGITTVVSAEGSGA